VERRRSRIVGRVEEQRLLHAAVRGAAEGRPCAVLVHGEAGVGKTRLVSAVCEQAEVDGFAVLWGRCLRFGAVEVPYGPLLSALDGWAFDAPSDEAADVLAAVPQAEQLMPSLGGEQPSGGHRLLGVVDAVVAAIARHRPTVLVVDDIHWGDGATRDALAYLIAGSRNQRLAILTTHRDEALVTGHPMHGWLADLVRMPGAGDLPLRRFTTSECEEQVESLLCAVPARSLVDDVIRRAEGNAYLTELLLGGVTSQDRYLPRDVPEILSEALLASWHALSPSSRACVRLLAVGGRPAGIDVLAGVGQSQGVTRDTLLAGLAEATDAGIVVRHGRDRCWLRHPLLAEVLDGTFAPGAAGPLHAAWAEALNGQSYDGLAEMRRQGDLALHFEGAGDVAGCFRASLRAGRLAEELRTWREAVVHLDRAAGLWASASAEVRAEVADEAALLERIAQLSDRIGDVAAAFDARVRAMELIDPAVDPLRASKLLVRWANGAWTLGRLDGEPFDEVREAVMLASRFPESAEYAVALANLSQCHAWTDELDAARPHADHALAVAQRSANVEALYEAHMAGAIAYDDDDRADHDSLRALHYAHLSDDPELLPWACVYRSNFLERRGRTGAAHASSREGLQAAIDGGAVACTAFMAGVVSRELLTMGRLAEARQVLREGLASSGSHNADASVRLNSARLAVRTGDIEAATAHLLRARSLVPGLETRPGLMAPAVLAEHLLAQGRPGMALTMLANTMPAHTPDPRTVDEMTVWAARAAADLAETARDLGDADGASAALASLAAVVDLCGGFRGIPFEVKWPEDLVQPAMAALFDAERARCAGEPASEAWALAARRCEVANMRWEQAGAMVRRAEALSREGAARQALADAVRAAHRLAGHLGATPLQQAVDGLAADSRISVDPVVPAQRAVPAGPLSTLTPREREILAHLVARRTYAEIAEELFISEKTVSSHVSNLLRKSGSVSRYDLAALAVRLDRSSP
jgi:DNA-binding CsgD family transcriptional regulator/tetratricopeptide (TPR) repeat protein